jgi:hypothetical protein
MRRRPHNATARRPLPATLTTTEDTRRPPRSYTALQLGDCSAHGRAGNSIDDGGGSTAGNFAESHALVGHPS